MKLQTAIRIAEKDLGALEASHRNARPLEDFSRFADDPVGFDVASVRDPVDYQRRIMQSVRDCKYTVVRGCHACGKEYTAGSLAVWAAYARRMLVLVISATERQVIGQTMREVRAAWKARPDLPGELYTSSVRIDGEDRIIALTGSAAVDALTGWHDPNGVLVIISEGQGERLEDSAYDAAMANTTDQLSRVLVLGNPIRSVGRFYEINHKPGWSVIRVSAFDTPNVKAGAMVRAGFPSPEWPGEMAAEYGGTDSPWYVSRVLAEFPAVGSVDSLLRVDWLEAAYARHAASAGLEPYPIPVAALDVARSYDRDESVCAIAQGSRVESLTTWRSRDLMDTAARFTLLADQAAITAWAQRRSQTVDQTTATWSDTEKLCQWCRQSGVPLFGLVVDAPGVGSGVIDDCRRRGRIVREYWGWSPATDEKRFANTRAQVYWNLRTLCQAGVAELPRDPAMHEEALAMQWSEDSKGRIIMVDKDTLRKTLSRSPDRLDSCVIALAESTGRLRASTVRFSSVAA